MSEPSSEFRERASCGVGAVVDLYGRGSHRIVEDALTVLERLDHRGARGAEENTGDGAGILIQKPDRLFRRHVAALPAADAYVVGQLFVPRNLQNWRVMQTRIEETVASRQFVIHAWRDVPIRDTDLGRGALETEPRVIQMFLTHTAGLCGTVLDPLCYLLRLALEKTITGCPDAPVFHVCSLDRRRIVYKGLLTNLQLRRYYPDLCDPDVLSSLALCHARFSTNTLGSWARAHPHRLIVHNGEINTYRTNFNNLRAREADLAHPVIGRDLAALKPLVEAGLSDTQLLDAAVELLLAGGRSLMHALRMLIPEAWRGNADIAAELRDWYDFHANLVEPWDGPALVVGSDGESMVAVLDRNGFRPCRYDITRDDQLILASEAGVLDWPASQLRERGRLGPGQMLVVDPAHGGLIEPAAVQQLLRGTHYAPWLRQRARLSTLAPARTDERCTELIDLEPRQRAAGYTTELLEHLLRPLGEDGMDPVGAMGDDAPPAVLSGQSRSLYDHFKQLFAQVSNPPIDYLRERLVTSLEGDIGPQGNLLGESSEHCRRVHLDSPLLSDGELNALRELRAYGLESRTVDLTVAPDQTLFQALDRACDEVDQAVRDKMALLVLSDRKSSEMHAPIPGLLGIGAVHQHLLRTESRLRVGLIAEVGDACTVHHVCTLLAFGADAVNPYLGLVSVATLTSDTRSLVRYLSALEHGVLKVMSKMGISTVESYRGSQLFEALGLADEVVERCFTGSVTRIGGSRFSDLEEIVRTNHAAAWAAPLPDIPRLPSGGQLYWRRDGEDHDWDPETLALLQAAVRTNDARLYRAFSTGVDRPAGGPRHLRSLLGFKVGTERAIEAVEPVGAIMRRFFSGSMSLGALSPEAHETIAIGMNRAGGTAHTGEGGEPHERFGTERECHNKQVASGRFGVTAAYLAAADQIEIKMAQGAKPGEGGQLPGHKVVGLVAKLRHTTPGIALISPPPHHDIYSIEDLAQLIHDLRAANPHAEIHVKLVSTPGIGTIAAGVVKAGADAILIAGDAGGTGAAAKTSIKSAGVPWELGLSEAQQVLIANRLRSRVRLRVDGGLKTGRDVVVAALLGAEEYGFGMAVVVAVGCIMLRKCHCNTCSVGIATQDPELRKLLPGRPEHVTRYMCFVAAEVREHLARLGARRIEDVIGRVDLLEQVKTVIGGSRRIDLGDLLRAPEPVDQPHCHGLPARRPSDQVDAAYIGKAQPALDRREPVAIEASIDNRHRSIGTRLSYLMTRRWGADGLPDGTLRLALDGVAGQSLGAFVNRGIEICVTGAANDYVGKGLSGGRIIVRPPGDAGFDPGQGILIGNAALYGATGGMLYVAGHSGERFAVRNSAALAVVEGCGDHACEYMTGGVAVILGAVGRNFAAGMTGGEVYLWRDLSGRPLDLDPDEFRVENVHDVRDLEMLGRLLDNHAHYTGSPRACAVLREWPDSAARFLRVIPLRYAEVIAGQLAEGRDLRPPVPCAAPSAGSRG